MATALTASLSEDEIYRVDHYLGKRGVQQIFAFRQHNQQALRQVLNRDHILRVDVVMTELEDCRWVGGEGC